MPDVSRLSFRRETGKRDQLRHYASLNGHRSGIQDPRSGDPTTVPVPESWSPGPARCYNLLLSHLSGFALFIRLLATIGVATCTTLIFGSKFRATPSAIKHDRIIIT